MIVLAGEALIDLTPQPGGALLPCPGGGPFNTAVALGRLGVPVGFLGRLSTDAFGRLLAARLADAGVDDRFTLHGPEATPLAVVTPGGEGRENEFQFYLEATAASRLGADDLPALDAVAAVHVGTLGLLLEPAGTALELLATRAARRVVVGLDPNIRPRLVADRTAHTARIHRLAALADVVKVSDADAAWLAPGEPPEALVAGWQAAGAGLVVVTRGSAGATAFGATRQPVHVPASPVTVADTVGAGDAFNAGLLAWLHDNDRLTPERVRALDGEALAAALAFAGRVAALTCARAGADPPWRSELAG